MNLYQWQGIVLHYGWLINLVMVKCIWFTPHKYNIDCIISFCLENVGIRYYLLFYVHHSCQLHWSE